MVAYLSGIQYNEVCSLQAPAGNRKEANIAGRTDSFMKKLLRNILIFIAPWIAYYAGHGILFGIPPAYYILPNILIPSLFLGTAGVIFTGLASVIKIGRPGEPGEHHWMVTVAVLVIIDQGIKQSLYSIDWETLRIPILPGFVIDPVINSYGSYIASILKLDVPVWIYFVLYAVAAVFYFEGFRYYMRAGRKSFWAVGALVLFFSGLLSVFLDNLFHQGSLDYLLIEPLFTCDLKDFYLTFGVIFMFTESAEHAAAVKKGEGSSEWEFRFRDLFRFIGDDVRKLRRRPERNSENRIDPPGNA